MPLLSSFGHTLPGGDIYNHSTTRQNSVSDTHDFQKSTLAQKPGKDLVLAGNEIPEPSPGDVLVKNYAVSLNPMDWYFPKAEFFLMKNSPVVIGEESAGIVEKIGEGITNVAVGDSVLRDNIQFPEQVRSFPGTYSYFCGLAGKVPIYDDIYLDVVVPNIGFEMPDNITFDQAASISVGILPFVAPTYTPEPHGFDFTAPFEADGGVGECSDQLILIMACGCSLSQYAIQLARPSGFSPVITTTSLHDTEYLQSLGVTHVLDRRLYKEELKECIAQIYGGTPLLYVFYAVSLEETQQIAYDSLTPGGKLADVFLQCLPRHDPVTGKRVLHAWGSFEVATSGVHEFVQRFMHELSIWLAEGKIKSNVVEVLPGGLNGIQAGLERLERREVSARKPIVLPQETEY